MILLDASGLSASRPGRPLFDNCSVTVSTGDRIAIVGLNGSGKSTLLRQLAGSSELETGEIRRGRGARVVMLDQDADLIGDTAFDVAGRGWESAAILDHLGLGGRGDERISTMSGGEIKRVALARALADVGAPGEAAHDVVLILDEPTNHLDIDAIAWLEERLASHRGALILVTHDRHVLDRLTTRILELDRGRTYVHEGGYASYLEAKAEREAQSERAEDVRRNLARSELAWLRRGAPARTRKPKARIEAATAIVEGKAQAATRAGELDLAFGARRLGDTVIDLAGVGHRFGAAELRRSVVRTPAGAGGAPAPCRAASDGDWLFRGVDLSLDPRERLGIIGPNGAGKSTLLDIVAGRLAPIEGTVSTGTTVTLGVYDQRGRELDPTMTVEQAVAGPRRRPDWEDARFLERFWFDPDAQRAPIGLLSGGERRRLQLVLTLRQKPNVILLDEPTNDLDLETLRVLEDVLEEWPGAVIVVSHDRAFLERTVTDILVIDDEHPGRRVPGGFGTWEAARRARVSSRGVSAKPRSAPRVAAAKAHASAAKSSAARATAPDASAVSARGTRATAPDASAVSAARATAPDASAVSARGTKAEATAVRRQSPSTLGRQLRDVEKSISALERQRDRLIAELAGAGTDVGALARVGTELAALEAEFGAAEQHWLDLAEALESAR